MQIKATNMITGEVIDLEANTYEQVISAWQYASELEKIAKRVKDKLKKIVPNYAPQGTTEPYKGVMFRVSSNQRSTYDKSVMRDIFDEDTFDLLLKPDKASVDKYLKEHLEDMGEDSTVLRSTMVPEGEPYQVIRLEKVG